jgi:hypothetical protein
MSDLTLEDEFEAHVRAAYVKSFRKEPTPEWLRALSMRAGTRGPVATLDDAGKVIGVTRERVRQVFHKIAPHLRGVELTKAGPVAELLVKRSPTAEPVGTLLDRAGLSRPTLTGPGLLNLLKLAGTSPQELVGTDLVPVEDWLVEESEVPVMRSVLTVRKHTSKYGMTTVEEIRQDIATPDNPLDPGDIRRVLRKDPTIKWAGDWLWMEKDGTSEHDNSMLNVVRQVLSVNQPQSLASVQVGVRRYFKFRKRDVVPPIEAMRVFLANHQEFVVDGDRVTSITKLDYHEVLGPGASAVVDVLKASEHQAMDWQSLAEACGDVGVNANSLTVWSTYASWLEKVGRRVYALRGSNPNPAAVTELERFARQRTASEARRTEWSWLPDGKLRLTMYVTTSLLSTGTFSAWGTLPAVITGRDIALTSDGDRLGYLKTSHTHQWAWGLGVAVRGLGATVGDVLRISIDLAECTGFVEVGGHELWE